MTDKENALRLLRFDHPERVISYLPARYIGYHGVNHQSYDEKTDGGHWREVGVMWKDIWGTGWVKDQPDVMGFPRFNPLSEPEMLADYQWPDPNDPVICNKIYESAKAFRESDNADEMFLAGSHRDTLWEKAYMLVGMENMMCYFFEEPEFVQTVLHKIMDFQLGIAQHYINVGIDIACLGDDMGTQRSLLFSQEIFDRFFYPEYKRLFDFYKSRGILIHFHSCGHIEPLLDTFMDLGVDILNPIQATANNLKNIIKKTHGRMTLNGAISSDLVMKGPVEKIREAVRDAIALLGKDGGYICAADQGMPYPKEHVEALWAAVEEFGHY